MNLKAWYQKRGISFILERAKRLNERYSFSPRKAIDRIESCVETLRELGCYPTFAVPGMVVEHHRSFIRRLQDSGAEIAVHGYNHVDLKACRPDDASRQLQHAADVFRANGLEVHGFRCPYLSVSDDLLNVIPHEIFDYSSNKAIQWAINPITKAHESKMFTTIESFYTPVKAENTFCLPWVQGGMVEIPVCVPDDLQLHDGLGYGLEQISKVWLNILHQTHKRGEVFNLMFHPELASFCEAPFLVVLQEARLLQHGVWLARLQDVSAWWREKSKFRVETEYVDGDAILKFFCSPRAAILYRGFTTKFQVSPWDEDYWRLDTRILRVKGHTLPLIGIPPGTPEWVEKTLSGMGYIMNKDTEANCSLNLDEACLNRFNNPVNLVAYIENTPQPLVRFWPWPDGMRSALCITGDLDALSFFDYAFRLIKR